jgi:hypothetical protein
MLKPNPSAPNDDRVPLSLASILLVEVDAELRDSRRLLLSSLQHPVLAVSSYQEVCQLPQDSNCRLVAIGICPNEHEAARIARYARKTWPKAKILLLGKPSNEFDDPLYDDSVSPAYNPSGVIDIAEKLVQANPAGDRSEAT